MSKINEPEKFQPQTVWDDVDWIIHNSGSYYLTGDIDEHNITPVIKWILAENIAQRHKQLNLFINSCGGDLYQAFGLIDIMKSSKIPVATNGIGSLMSAAFLIFMSGVKGKRFITKNTSIMSHQFSTFYEGKEHDVKASEKETRYIKQRMLDVMKESCSMDERMIKRKLLPPSDVWLSAEECVELGVADATF
jgi:ATP-dependent Clp protease, protease subunit